MAAEEPSYCDPYSRSDAVAEARVEVETRVLGKKDKGAWEAILARLKSIEKQSFNKEDSMIDTLHKEAAKVSNRVLVAEATTRSRRFAGEGIVGYLIYSNNLKQEGCSRILKVAVAKANRRQGVGRALLTAACRLSKAERSPSMQLHVALARDAAYNLYLSEGFKVLSLLPDYYAPGRHAYLMENLYNDARRNS